MTVTGEPDSPLPPAADPAPRSSRHREASAVHELCPYLASEDGSWRSAYAARDHVCHAVEPAAPLALAKQRQLCLVAAHTGCATFTAAEALKSAAAPVAPGDDGAALWPASTSTPLVLEPARRMVALPVASARTGGQAVLIGLMALAFLVLVIARTQSPGAADGSASPASASGIAAGTSPSIAASVSPSSTPSPTPEPSPSASASPSPSASPTPRPTPSPTPTATVAANRTYKVKSGDTLSGIAARNGTTVAVLVKLNNITDPRLIKVGQVLRLP
jgi:LysM repeat protein